MEEMLVETEGFSRVYRKMGAEVRLLYVACLCFIVAQYVANDHPWNSGFRIVALLALIAALLIGFSARRKT